MSSKWLSIIGVAFLVFAVCNPSSQSTKSSGRSACEALRLIGDDIYQESGPDAKFEKRIRNIEAVASDAEPSIRDAAARLAQALGEEQPTALRMAAVDMLDACAEAGY